MFLSKIFLLTFSISPSQKPGPWVMLVDIWELLWHVWAADRLWWPGWHWWPGAESEAVLCFYEGKCYTHIPHTHIHTHTGTDCGGHLNLKQCYVCLYKVKFHTGTHKHAYTQTYTQTSIHTHTHTHWLWGPGERWWSVVKCRISRSFISKWR